ncbi:MAG: SLC13 family permease [Planctomycetota bacterium]
MTKRIALFGGPIAACLAGIALLLGGGTSAAAWTAAVVVLCATWWVFEPIPIPVTSLIPLAVFPLVGVLSTAQVGQAYGHWLVLLMMGGFMLSVAMERSNTHRRIALTMVNWFGGGGGRGLVFGFMAAAATLSMWISNAATTLMLLPIAMAVVAKSNDPRLRVSLLLGIAYAASIGGIGTPIGTPPNLVFMREYAKVLQDGDPGLQTDADGAASAEAAVDTEPAPLGDASLEVVADEAARALSNTQPPTFLEWMSWSLPIALIMLPITGFWLTRNLKTTSKIELPEVGRWRTEEVRTLTVFAVTALLWMTRADPLGGWSGWLGLEVKDSSIALLSVVAMFLIPNGNKDGEKLLDWESAVKIPWGILILYGGGIAIAQAFEESGLNQTIGEQFRALAEVPVVIMIVATCLFVTFLTEVTSNSATANLLMPIMGLAAVNAGIEARVLMVPATISCSFAFMLPVATPPNAIVFGGSDDLTIKQMAREGLALNLVGVVVVSAVCLWLFT